MEITKDQITQATVEQNKQIDSLSEPQRTNYNQLIETYNGGYTQLADGIPICDMYKSFINEFTTIEPKTEVEKLASEKVPVVTDDLFIKTVNNYEYHEDVFPYSNYGKDLKWIFKRLLACYYKKNEDTNTWSIDWFDFKEQIGKDVHRNEGIIFNNDNQTLAIWNPRVNKEPRDEDLLVNDYYKYICFEIINKNIQTTQFNQLDLINICNTIVAQTFKATWFADFSKPASGFGLTDGPYRPDRPDRYNLFCLLYGPRKNSTNYNVKENTITFNMYQNAVNLFNMNNFDNSGLGFRIINIKMTLDLNKNEASLSLIFYQSFNLYRYGVYIGVMDIENNTLDADGEGIFYIDNYNSDTAKYPTAKVSGTFSKGFLKAGTMVDIELYSSEDDFYAKTYKDGLDKSNGVIQCLKQIKPGYIKIPNDIDLNKVNYDYLETLFKEYTDKQQSITNIIQQRNILQDIENATNTKNYVKTDNSLSNTNNGIIWFQPDSNGRQYFYDGPIRVDTTAPNILYVSLKNGTIKQVISKGQPKTYIKSLSNSNSIRQNWYEFVLKPKLSNYKTINDLPLQWTNFTTDLNMNIFNKTAIAGLFTKEILEKIGKTSSIDNDIFSDKARLLKILEQLYIESIIYLSAFILITKKYKNISKNPQIIDILNTILQKLTSDNTSNRDNSNIYDSFVSFNDKISEKYLFTQLPTNNKEYGSTQSIILPILASLRPETDKLFEPIDININTELDTNNNILIKLLIIINKNIILVLYLLTMVTANLGDMCKSLLPNYDPLVVTPIYNLFKDSYDNIIKNSDPNINPGQALAIENSADNIIKNNADELLSILLMIGLLFDKQKYSGRGGYKTKRKRHSRKTWNTKKKNILKNYRLNRNKNSNKKSKKHVRVSYSHFTRRK